MAWTLVRLGWTEEKAGELFGLTRTGIEGIDEKLNRNIFVICQQFNDKNAKNMDENIFSIYQQFYGKVGENIPIVCAQFWNKRKSAGEICALNDMDEITTWAMILGSKDDLERLKKLDVTLKVYDVWSFSEYRFW